MDKQRFIELISQPDRITSQESEDLVDIVKKHPYSAILKVMLAKVSRINHLNEEKKLTTSAAIATSDRNNFKNYLEASYWPLTPVTQQPVSKDPLPQKPVEEEPVKEEPKPAFTKPEKTVDQKSDKVETKEPEEKKQEIVKPAKATGDEADIGRLSKDLIKNIEEYKENRKQFEILLEKQRESTQKQGSPKESSKKSVEKQEKKEGKKKEKAKKEDIKSHSDTVKSGKKKTADKETADSNTEKPAPKSEIKEDPEETVESESKEMQHIDPDHINITSIEQNSEKKIAEGYELHEEEDPKVIKKHLKKLVGDMEADTGEPTKKLRKKEQEEIIEKFIKSQPKIKNVKSESAEKQREDLSLPSVKFSDNIISENLAQIMIKQKKFEKAIDIYKKLIWKFPQKKTYFASQIEELKKKSGK